MNTTYEWYPTLDWWQVKLQENGFDMDGKILDAHGSKKDFHGFKRGDFKVMLFCDSAPLSNNGGIRTLPCLWFRAWYKNSSTDVMPLGSCERISIIVEFLQAVQYPDRMPLLVGVKWLIPIIEAYYRNVHVKT